MEPEAGEVDGPHDVCDVGENERTGRRAVRRAYDRRLQPLRHVLGDALLEERAPLRAVRETLHQCGPAAGNAHERLSDVKVVPHQGELCLPSFREEDLVRARDRDLSPVDVEHVLVGHPSTVSTMHVVPIG